jgi:arylsulfatase A-like enzyme
MPQAMPPGYENKVKDIKHPVRARCVAMTMNMDDAVGEILDALRATGQEERTLIVFTSDNGGTALPDSMIKNGSLNVPYRGVKGDVYEGGMREPFVIQWKSHLPAGKTLDAPVSSLDLLPTALAVAGARPLPGSSLEGVNLLPYLTGTTKDAPHEVLYWRWQNKCAVRQGDWKWVRVKNDPEELYNLATDPYEKTNCAASHPEELKKLAGRFAAWNTTNPELNPAHFAKDAEATAAGESDSMTPNKRKRKIQ